MDEITALRKLYEATRNQKLDAVEHESLKKAALTLDAFITRQLQTEQQEAT
ncbi:MAG: hypothetical protein ACYSR9_04190 [Planctomycetota bacterium]|jgi:hypothetical protein